MNEAPNAITAAAAAIAVLMASHPIMAYTQPLAHAQDPTTLFSCILLGSIASVASHSNIPSPHPEQGGQCITLHWLYSLSEESCLWQFQLVYFNLEKLNKKMMGRSVL